MAGSAWTFCKIGGDCFLLMGENYDFNVAHFATPLALALAFLLAAGYLVARLCKKRPGSP